MAKLSIIDDGNGTDRKLGLLPPTAQAMKLMSGMTSLSAYRKSKGLPPTIPRSEWKHMGQKFGTKFKLDQLSYGACVGASGVAANMRLRSIQGLSFVALSWAYVYDWINHGRDNGAIIVDSMEALKSQGAPPFSDYPIPKFKVPHIDAAKRFRLSKALVIDSFDEMATALLMRLFPQFAVQAGKNFNKFTKEGVCGFVKGPGNHSVHGESLDFLGSEPVIRMPNSWGLWGPWRDGCAYVTEQHIASCIRVHRAYCHIDDILDPQDPKNPPETV